MHNNSRQPIIQVQGLIKTYGHFLAIRGIDLELNEGDFLTLFGPNGAGKTTLIRILSTMLRPTSGTVRIAGYDITEETDQLRKNIGVISHQLFLYGHLSALENIIFYSRLYNLPDPRERALKVIEEVGLGERANDLVRTFSRGMLQRLSIARAIVHDPKIIFLDEPYTGLDQHAANMLKNLLMQLHDQKRTIILITHNLQRGFEMANRLAIQVKGRIIFNEDKDNVDMANFEELYFKTVGCAD